MRPGSPGALARTPGSRAVLTIRKRVFLAFLAGACGKGAGRALLGRMGAADVGKCERVETHVQREGWETFGADCRMAGRQLSAGRHV